MYGSNYTGGHHHAQGSSRNYQSPSQLSHSHSSGPYNADPQLLQWFNAVDTDRSGSISVSELQAALVNGQGYFPRIVSKSGLMDPRCYRKLVE
jgi:hypothetical protein